MQLALAGQHRLAGLGVLPDGQRRVFLGELVQRAGQPHVVLVVGGRDRQRIDRRAAGRGNGSSASPAFAEHRAGRRRRRAGRARRSRRSRPRRPWPARRRAGARCRRRGCRRAWPRPSAARARSAPTRPCRRAPPLMVRNTCTSGPPAGVDAAPRGGLGGGGRVVAQRLPQPAARPRRDRPRPSSTPPTVPAASSWRSRS